MINIPQRKIRKHIELSNDDYEWFVKTHTLGDDQGYKTGFSALMNLLLKGYRTICERDEVSPIDLAQETGSDVKEQIDESKGSAEGVGDNDYQATENPE